MTTIKNQLRGNCQCCGREQAVLASTGLMAKHGYVVKDGWFQGACRGHDYQPMQEYRGVTDQIVAKVRKEVAELHQQVADLKAGKIHPAICKIGFKPNIQEVPFADAPVWEQRRAIETAIHAAESRARHGEHFANDLEALADRVHGQPLREEKVSAGPAPINAGERRISPRRGVLVAKSIYRGQVSWLDEKGFRSSMSTRSWRALELAP